MLLQCSGRGILGGALHSGPLYPEAEVCFGHCPSVTARSTSDIRLPTRYSLSKWQPVSGGIETT